MSKSGKPNVGLLGLTLEYYETLAPGLRPGREQWVRERLLGALEPLAEVRFDRALCRREEIEWAVAAFEADGVDALLVVCLTYSPSQIALPALSHTTLPILVWNTQQLEAVDDHFTAEAMIENHGVHGTQDLCNVLLRSGVPFEYVTSHGEEPAGLERLGDFFAAAAAVRALRHCRIGLLGYPFPGMGDFALDTTHMAATLGCSVVQVPFEEYVTRTSDADATETASRVEQYRSDYDVDAAIAMDDLAAAARAESALRRIVAEHRLDALTYQFLAFGEDERSETLPFVAISRLMADGVGFGGEGDVIACAGTWLLHRLHGPATFSEIFTIDFAGGGLLMSHMGEANVAMARPDRKTRLVARETPITPTRRAQLALVTCLRPGPATLAAVTLGPEQRWRIIASRGEIADFGPLTTPAPHWKFRPVGDVRDWLTAYAKAGGPHHNAICFGDARRPLEQTARLLDADYVEV